MTVRPRIPAQAPLAAAPMIDGIFYDAFNYGYDIPETTPWGPGSNR